MQPPPPPYQPDRMDPRNMLSPQTYTPVSSYPQSVHHSTVGSISAKPMDPASLHISNKPSTVSETGFMERNQSMQSLQNWQQPMMLQPNIAQTPSRRTSRMGLAQSSPTLSQHFLREDAMIPGTLPSVAGPMPVKKSGGGFGTPTKMQQQANLFAPTPYTNMMPPQMFQAQNPFQQQQQQQSFIQMMNWMQHMYQMQQHQPSHLGPPMGGGIPGEAQQQNLQNMMKQVESYHNIIEKMEKERPQPARVTQQQPAYGAFGESLSSRQLPSSLEGSTSFISHVEDKKELDRGVGYQAPMLPQTDRAPVTFAYDEAKDDPLDLYKNHQIGGGGLGGYTTPGYESLGRVQQASPDVEINDLRPPTAQGNHPPQQEMLEKYDFKDQREEPHQPAGPQSQNLGLKDAKQKTEQSSPRLSTSSQNSALPPRRQNAFDEKPISKPMNFEELLAQKINEDGGIKSEISKDVAKPKREFLKRNSKKVVSKVPQNSKKYNYYLSHFTDEFGERRSERKKAKPNRAGFYKTSEQDNLLDEEEEEEHQQQLAKKERNKREKVFLKRGGGTGGGKGKKEKPKMTKYGEEQEEDYFYKKGWEQEDRAVDIKKQKKKLNIFDEESEDEDEHLKRNETDPQMYQNNRSDEEANDDEIKAQSEEDVRKTTSSIVQTYYLDKTKKVNEQKKAAQKKQGNKAEEVAVQALRDKVEELQVVLDEQKRRNLLISKREIEMKREVDRLKKERKEFEELKRLQKEEFESMKQNELKKLKKEKKLMERQAKSTQPNRKEREEIEKLKKEVAKLQEDLKTKEHRHKLYVDRLKRQIDDLSIKNSELELEVQHLESMHGTKKATTVKKSTAETNNVPRYNFSSLGSEEAQFMKTEMEAVKEQDSEQEDGQSARSATQYDDEEKQHEEEQPSQEEDDEEEKRREEEASNRAPRSSSGVNESFEMVFPDRYHSMAGLNLMSENVGANGKVQRIYSNGKKEIMFNNGVRREVSVCVMWQIFPDGYTVVYFNNQDIKQTYPDGKVVYFFAEARTTQTTYTDNLQVFKFQNGQIEKHFPDGTKQIKQECLNFSFPDGTIKCIFSDGEEESIFPDGTIQRIEKSGVKSIEYSNGQKVETNSRQDILQPDGIRIREFPDGRVRKTYPNGEVENTIKQDI